MYYHISVLPFPPYICLYNRSSWGGSMTKDDSGMYHMFVSEWVNNCGIAYWTPNSRIVRATASSPTGPFIIQQEVLPTFWTNPQLVRANDENRTWLLYTDGMDCDRVVDCRNASKPLPHRLPTCAPHKHMEVSVDNTQGIHTHNAITNVSLANKIANTSSHLNHVDKTFVPNCTLALKHYRMGYPSSHHHLFLVPGRLTVGS